MTKYPYQEWLPLAQLRKNAENPNQMDERTFNALVESIQEENWTEVITVVPTEEGYEIVGGHHRFDAADYLELETVPCWVLDPEKFDQDRRDWNLVKMNVLRGKLNPSKFTALWTRMSKQYEDDVLKTLMGFTSEDAFKSLYTGVRSALPPEMQKALDDQRSEIKTIDGLSLLLNQLFTEHGETLPSNVMAFSFGSREVMWILADKDLWALACRIRDEALAHGGDVAEAMYLTLHAGAQSLANVPDAAPAF